jgi:hypothetical protein
MEIVSKQTKNDLLEYFLFRKKLTFGSSGKRATHAELGREL